MKKYLLAVFVLALLAVRAAATNYTLTLSTAGPISPAIVFSSDPATGIDCGSSSTACSASFSAGSTVTLTEIPSSTMAFAGWGGLGSCEAAVPTCSVLMNGAQNITARFNPTLSVSLAGSGSGSVADASGTVNCGMTGACASSATATVGYFPGTLITLTATPTNSSATFTGWGGACSGTGTCSLTLNVSAVAVATFTQTGPSALQVVAAGTAPGTITSSPGGINCPGTCSHVFTLGTSVTLTATAGAGHTFAGWANGGCSGTSTCTVVVREAQQGLGGADSPAAFFY